MTKRPESGRIDDADPFAPERIEATIAAVVPAGTEGPDSPQTAATTLVRALVDAYALQPEAESAALARVHARLVATLASEHASAATHEFEPEPHRHHWYPPPRGTRRVTRLGASLRAIAAMLVVALLGAGFYAALHGRSGSNGGSGRATAEQPGWHDVGITHAHTSRLLDFDPALGVTYAVNEASGDIYACGGSGHVWYSTDGGANYAPFPLTLPTDAPGTVTCAIATAPGAAGLFIRLVGVYGSAPTRNVAYIAAPGKVAALVTPPSKAASLADPSEQISVNPDQFQAMLFTGGLIGPVRMAGGWLFATVWDDQLSRTVLVGTPDFGQRWYWLDAPITAHSPIVVDKFAVDPADPNRLFLGVHPGATADGLPSIAMSVDGGKTWQGLPYDSPYGVTLAGASTTAVFGLTKDDAAGHTALLRRDFTNVTTPWQGVALIPSGSGVLDVGVLDVGPDGIVYAVENMSGEPPITVRTFTLAPGASAFRLVWPQTTLSRPGKNFAFALGGIWPGAQPALYLDGGSGPSTGAALYRLALSVSASPPQASPSTSPEAPSPIATCTSSTDLAAIQPGGLGAQLGTFPVRWGAQLADDGANIYFGRWADTGAHKLGVAKPGADQRVSSLTYYPDTTQHLSLTDAEALAREFLPTDAKPISLGAPTGVNTNPVTLGFCSSAYYAAFPPGSASPSYGRLAVNFWKSANGDVNRIDLSTLVLG